jgi:hypothetical protein
MPRPASFTSHELSLNPSSPSRDLLPTVRVISIYVVAMADSPIDRFCNPFGNPRAYLLGTAVKPRLSTGILVLTETGCGYE